MGKASKSPSNFQRFFFRGLGIVLPTILTLWILVAVYGFVNVNIAAPINEGVREMIVRTTRYPEIVEDDLKTVTKAAAAEGNHALTEDQIALKARRLGLERRWQAILIGQWQVLDLIGVFVAIVLIYIFGLFFGGIFGRQLYRRGEEMLKRVPIFKAVYPYVKQVTDFLFGDEEKKAKQFNDVVAVEYPRKGLWSIGLVTGDTMRTIQAQSEEDCLTVFIPSSPTPFTGYVITVPRSDTISLSITIDEALRFTVSGGVIIPTAELVEDSTEA